MNHLMDCRAKDFLLTNPAQPSLYIFWESWMVFLPNGKLSGSLREELTSHCTTQRRLLWWKEKRKHQSCHFDKIDWAALDQAMSSLPLPRQHWIAKHSAGFCGVGTVLKKWKWQDTDLCPRCNTPEDPPHVWSCQAQEAIHVWEHSVSKLAEWMTNHHTSPFIRDAICQSLLHWKRGLPPSQPSLS